MSAKKQVTSQVDLKNVNKQPEEESVHRNNEAHMNYTCSVMKFNEHCENLHLQALHTLTVHLYSNAENKFRTLLAMLFVVNIDLLIISSVTVTINFF